jgi:hypothetical protein
MMSAVGYDYVTLGNHEFDFGIDAMSQRMAELSAKVLCGNFASISGVEYYLCYDIRQYGDVSVAFVGVTTPDVPTTSTPAFFQDSSGVWQYTFFPSSLDSVVQHCVDEVRGLKADYVVLLSHVGETDLPPLVVATIADSVKERLQGALTEYRTKKARHDLKYIESLYKEAKEKYEKSCVLYADFTDSNQGIMLESVRLKQTKLENDMQLYYNNYNAISTQLLAAKAKVQEKTPAFTTLQDATVPLGNAGPMRKRIVLLFLLFVFLCHSAWILYRENELKLLLGLEKKKK